MDPLELTREIVGLTAERWVSADRLTNLAERMGARDAAVQVAFLGAVRGMLMDLPVKIFPDTDAREALLKAAQAALDRAIEREEETA